MIQQLEAVHKFLLGHGVSDWMWATGVLILAIGLGRVAAGLILRALASAADKTKAQLDDLLVLHLRRPLHWAGPLLLVRWFLRLLPLHQSTYDWCRQTLLLALVLVVGWMLLSLVYVVEAFIYQRFEISGKPSLAARAIHTQVRSLKNVARFLIVVLTLAAALMTFQSVRAIGAGLLASTSVVGIVVGFAAQRSIAMVVSGIHIALAQPIRINDVVVVEKEWGHVEEITLTYAVIKIWDERRLVIPINYFVEKPFENWSRGSPELLGTVELQLPHAIPIDDIREELTRLLEAADTWDGRVNKILITKSTEFTRLLRVTISAKDDDDQWNLRCHLREKLHDYIENKYGDQALAFPQPSLTRWKQRLPESGEGDDGDDENADEVET